MTEKTKNPKRVAAGRANRAKRKPISAETREKLRKAIRRNKPWLWSTGPKTAAGKKKSASNVRWRYAFSDGSILEGLKEFAAELAQQQKAKIARTKEGDSNVDQ